MQCDRVIGAVLFVLVLGAGDGAEARGRGGRVAVRTATIGSAPVAATGSIAADAGPADPAFRPVKAVIAPRAPELREVRAPESRCAAPRRVGTGAGFCLIN